MRPERRIDVELERKAGYMRKRLDIAFAPAATP